MHTTGNFVPFGGHVMRRTEALQGVRMIKFLDILGRYEALEFNQLEAAEHAGQWQARTLAPMRTAPPGLLEKPLRLQGGLVQ
jgi:hypothetical protein